ncbi:MAG TPA: glycoside hydrolase family protein [Caulobacterales bacterium]|nr:glycoside hydrolase family protein [Caulobacterales bacterium]
MSSHAISADGLALIQQFEGFRAAPTQLPDGNWVVGHGHVRIGDAGAPVERAEARALLALDLAPIEIAVNTLVKVEISQQQFDALVSFAFSLGLETFEKSDVLRKLNAGHVVAAGCAMDAWRKSDVGGELEVIDALVRRRAAEKALFLADAPVETAPSVFMRAKLDHAASILGAPIAFAPAPDVTKATVIAPKAEPAQIITEVLKAEPATEALLLTQVATEEQIAAHDEAEEEIVTAHAKPVARRVDEAAAEKKEKRQIDRRIRNARVRAARADQFKQHFHATVETVGLLALFVFGAALIVLAGATYFGGRADAVDTLGASALAAPGLVATGMAIYGLWKTPFRRVAHAS